MAEYLGDTLISGTEIQLGKPLNIGQIIESILPLTDAGLHLLDGALINGSGIYSAFVDYIADLYDGGNYPDLFVTEANWQSAVTTYGVCGKFVYDSVNNTVRLPKITGIIEGTTDLTALGDLVEAGLPNHTHNIETSYSLTNVGGGGGSSWDYIRPVNGASSKATTGVNTPSLYGKSNTVQPQTIKVLYYIVIATTTKTEIEVDIDQIATDLNGKANVNLTNLSNTGKIAIAHNAMPSNTWVDLTLGASGTSYIAPADGYFTLNKKADVVSAYLVMYNVPNGMYSIEWAPDFTVDDHSIWIPAKKGDEIIIYFSGTGAVKTFRFIYAQGSESEAS